MNLSRKGPCLKHELRQPESPCRPGRVFGTLARYATRLLKPNTSNGSMLCENNTDSGRFARRRPVRILTADSRHHGPTMHQTPFSHRTPRSRADGHWSKPSSADEDVLRIASLSRNQIPLVERCYLILKRELNVPKKTRHCGFRSQNRNDGAATSPNR